MTKGEYIWRQDRIKTLRIGIKHYRDRIKQYQEEIKRLKEEQNNVLVEF